MDFAVARQNMVDCQILPNRVDDRRVIDAMSEIPREKFVPDELCGIAYVDGSLPLSNGRCVMEPMVIARLLQTADLNADDVALSIGCGSGYAVAVLAKVVDTVVAVESDKGLAQKAGTILAELGLNNVAVVDGDMKAGNAAQGPYNVIFFDGAVDRIPTSITDQLAEGGRLVAIVAAGGVGTAQIISRHGGVLSTRNVFDAGTAILPGFEPEAAFSF